MKKTILIMSFLLFISSLSAQRIKFSGDFMIEQNFALNDQHKDKRLNDALRSMSTTFLTGRLNAEIIKNWEVYTKISVGVSKRGKDVNECFNMYNEYSFDGYVSNLYARNSKSNFTYLTDQFSIGVSHRLFSKSKWTLKPSLGIGYEFMRTPELNYDLKENGTNTAYHVDYRWYNTDKSIKNLGFLTAEISVPRPLSRKIDLKLAANYRFFFTKSDFSWEMKNYYTHDLINSHKEKGKNQHTLGLSLGITLK